MKALDMIEHLFRGSLASKLHALGRAARNEGFQCGRQIHCHFGVRPKNHFGFSASIVTNDARRGDVNGIYHFFSSKDYPGFRQGLASLTAEVAGGATRFPKMAFFRVFSFCKPEDVEHYLKHHEEMKDKDGWLEKAITCHWAEKRHFVREQFELGSWTPRANEPHEMLSLISGEIGPIDQVL